MKSRIVVPASYPAGRYPEVLARCWTTLEAVYENDAVTLIFESGESVVLSRQAWNALVRGSVRDLEPQGEGS